jgi:predicted nucleic acid-binding protein
MILIDSCGWIEFLGDGSLASAYEPFFEQTEEIVTPTIVVYEVFKKVKRERSEEDALMAAALMQTTKIIPLTGRLALLAADLSLQYSIPMADACIYATAISEQCKIVTSDLHFSGLDNVILITRQ